VNREPEDSMSDLSFTTTFSVDQTPGKVIDAVKDVRGWWSEHIEGGTEEPGDEFTYRYEDAHRCEIRVTEVVPDRRVSWLVLDNYFNFTQDSTEWTDTTIHFDVAARDGGTEVTFTHQGLVPADECFESCSQGWEFFVNTSLRDLITTGEGQPIRAEPRTAAQAVATGNDR